MYTNQAIDHSGSTLHALIVDDEPDVAAVLARVVSGCGDYRTTVLTDPRKVLDTLRDSRPDVMFLDLVMPNLDGFQVLERARQFAPDLTVVVVSTYSTVENAVRAVKQGAFDFLSKPFDPDSVSLILAKTESELALRANCRALRDAVNEQDPYLRSLLGESVAMMEIRDWILKVRDVRANVVIEGETGTGKEIVARAIHASHGPFVAVNMAAIPEDIADSELFGHRRGAFTGASADRKGLILEANGGTLFLDEVNAMSSSVQAKLLRVIQERRLRPVGADRETAVDIRIISATNECVEELAGSGRFRRDLFHRLRVLARTLPPLRERREDIPLLAHEFLERYARRYARRARRFSPPALNLITHRDYPGNIRQLENLIEEAVILAPEDAYELEADLFAESSDTDDSTTSDEAAEPRTLVEAELAHIAHIMKLTGGNKTHAARILHVDYKTLLRKLAKSSSTINSGTKP